MDVATYCCLAKAGGNKKLWRSPNSWLRPVSMGHTAFSCSLMKAHRPMQTRHSSLLLKPVGAETWHFPNCLAEAGKCVPPHTFSGCLIKGSRHMQSTQGMFLDNLALWQRGLAFLGSTGLQQLERQFLASHHPQDTVQRADGNTPPVFLWQSPI